MKYKTPVPTRTKTRARLDVALYSLYYKLHDGKPRAIAATRYLRSVGLGTELLEDLRQLGRVTSTGKGRGQRHAWTGAPPDPILGDQVENLRELRAAKKAARRQAETEAPAPCPTAAALVQEARLLDLLTADELLDHRNLIDRLLRDKTQPRLF